MLDTILFTTRILAASGEDAISKDDLISKIFPTHPWDLVVQLIAFLLLIAIVTFLGYKPVKKLLKKRADYVQGQIAEAQEKNKAAELAASKKEETIAEGRLEAERIVNNAKKTAEESAKSIRAEAEADAEARRARADKEIEEAKEASLEEVKASIVDVALSASSALLGREVDSEDNRKLVSSFVDNLKEEGK